MSLVASCQRPLLARKGATSKTVKNIFDTFRCFFRAFFPSRDFKGSVGIKNPCFFGGFPCFLLKKKQEKEGQGGGTVRAVLVKVLFDVFLFFFRFHAGQKSSKVSTTRGHVKNREKVSKNMFDTFRRFSRRARIFESVKVLFSVEPKVRLQEYGYNPFCSHSSRCLAVLVWQYFEEAFCAPKVRLKWYGFKGFPSHSSHCSGGLFPQYSGVSPFSTFFTIFARHQFFRPLLGCSDLARTGASPLWLSLLLSAPLPSRRFSGKSHPWKGGARPPPPRFQPY